MQKKILWIHTKGGFFGGAEQNIYLTAKNLPEYSHYLIYSDEIYNDNETFLSPFTSVYCTPFDRCAELVEKIDPDLIYMHKCLSLPLLKFLTKSKIPILRMVHDHEVYCLRGSKYFPLTRTVCKHKAGLCCLFFGLAFLKRDPVNDQVSLCLPPYLSQKKLVHVDQRCQGFIVATHYMAEELVRQGYPQEKIRVHPPITEQIDREQKMSTFSEENRIVYMGQLLRGKGLDCLIESLEYIDCPFRLDIFGNGPYRRNCEQLAAKYDNVYFHGFLSHQDLEEHLLKTTVGVIPSLWPEPFGAVGLEFMRYGIPVVGFDSGGIGEWLLNGETGYLITPKDIVQMGTKIARLLKDKKKSQTLGRKGFENFKNRYSLENYINSIKMEFKRLL